MWEKGNKYGVLWGNLKEIDHLEEIYVDGRICKLISKKQGKRTWPGLIWLRTETDNFMIYNPHQMLYR